MGLGSFSKSLLAGVKVAGRAVAGAASVVKDVAVKNKRTVSAVTGGVVKGAGAGTKLAGKGIAASSAAVAGLAHRAGAKSEGLLGKTLGHAVGYIADGAALIGTGTAKLGEGVVASARTVADATAGFTAGSTSVVSESLDAVAIPDEEIEARRRELVRYGEVQRRKSQDINELLLAKRHGRPSRELLDSLVVGGITLSAAIASPSAVPTTVEEAFRLAYPVLASRESFGEAAGRMSPEELAGLVSGVKGKLFELEFVAHLNSGALPEGYVASMSSSATQAGWDIQIVDGTGQVAELLQAKATESVRYVQQALERYPGIEVVATSEVYAQLAAVGAAEGVRDSGIAETALEEMVRSSAELEAAFDMADLLPSAVGLAVVGLSVFLDKSISPEERAQIFGERGVRVGVSSVAGYALMAATQLWWLAVLGGLGTHWLTGKGRFKRAQLEGLKSMLTTLRRMPSVGATAAPSG